MSWLWFEECSNHSVRRTFPQSLSLFKERKRQTDKLLKKTTNQSPVFLSHPLVGLVLSFWRLSAPWRKGRDKSQFLSKETVGTTDLSPLSFSFERERKRDREMTEEWPPIIVLSSSVNHSRSIPFLPFRPYGERDCGKEREVPTF